MNYYLAEACQNTFVLFDHLDAKTLSQQMIRKAHEALLKHDRDDALILFNGKEKGSTFICEMAVIGQDAMLAEFCGNGSRSCAAYIDQKYPHFKAHFFKTKRGLSPMKNIGLDNYLVQLPLVSQEFEGKFMTNSNGCKGSYVEVLEPHLVINKEMSDEELLTIGKKLNRMKDLFPYGINVNGWHRLGKRSIFVKTYERGVQRLTRSCGTGSAACVSSIIKKGPMHVTTPGGPLKIIITEEGIELIGEGKVCSEYSGSC